MYRDKGTLRRGVGREKRERKEREKREEERKREGKERKKRERKREKDPQGQFLSICIQFSILNSMMFHDAP